MTADIGAALAKTLFTRGNRAVADAEVDAVMRYLRALDPNTILDEVDVRVIRDAIDTYREARRPAVREDYQ
jgi:hypothetical protein